MTQPVDRITLELIAAELDHFRDQHPDPVQCPAEARGHLEHTIDELRTAFHEHSAEALTRPLSALCAVAARILTDLTYHDRLTARRDALCGAAPTSHHAAAALASFARLEDDTDPDGGVFDPTDTLPEATA